MFKRPQPKRWTERFRFQPYPSPSSRAQNPSRKVEDTSRDHDRAPMQSNLSSLTAEENEAHFKLLYGPCNAGSRSSYHDIKCGHRVYVEYAKECGANCKNEGPQNPFVCPVCIAEEVRTEMLLEGLNIVKDDDDMDDGSREQTIRKIADRKIYDLITPASVRLAWNKHKAPKVLHRLCKMAEKFEDPKMQFFDKFLKDEGLGGIDPSGERKGPFIRPFHQHSLPQIPKASPWPAPGPSAASAPPPLASQTNARPGHTSWPKEHDDPNAIWCTCRQQDDGHRMVMCDDPNCQYVWYHFRCLKREERPADGVETWICPDCVDVQPPEKAEISFAPTTTGNSDALDDIADQMGDVHVGEQIEDDVTKAVREALAAFALKDEK